MSSIFSKKFISPKKNPFFKNFLEETRPPYSLEYAQKIQSEIDEFIANFKELWIQPRESIRNGPRMPILKKLFHGRKEIECHYCGTAITKEKATFDHVFAFSDGGSNSLSNMVLCCQPCNVKKSDLGYYDYLLTLNNHENQVKKISKNKDFINQTLLAMTALEPSIMEKLDKDCPLWGSLLIPNAKYGKVTPAFHASLVSFEEMSVEKDPDRNIERLQILLRVWRKAIREETHFLVGKILEKDWIRISWYEFERDNPKVRRENHEIAMMYKKFAHFFPSIDRTIGFEKLVLKISSKFLETQKPSIRQRKIELELVGKILREIQYKIKVPDFKKNSKSKESELKEDKEKIFLKAFNPKLWEVVCELLEHATNHISDSNFEELLNQSKKDLYPLVLLLNDFKKVHMSLMQARKNMKMLSHIHPGVSDLEMMGYSEECQAWEELCQKPYFSSRYSRLVGLAYHVFPNEFYEQGFCFDFLKDNLKNQIFNKYPEHILKMMNRIQIKDPIENQTWNEIFKSSQGSKKSVIFDTNKTNTSQDLLNVIINEKTTSPSL